MKQNNVPRGSPAPRSGNRASTFLKQALDQSIERRLAAIKEQIILIASGMSRINDLSTGAYTWRAEPKRGIGVDAGELSENGIEQIAEAVVEWKTLIFIDSGAFSLFKKNLKKAEEPFGLFGTSLPEPDALDFDSLLLRYQGILATIQYYHGADETESYPKPLLVLPDVIGDQAASLELIDQWAWHIRDELDRAIARFIVPIPKGQFPLAYAYRRIVNILGRDDFIVGLPSVEKSITEDELRDFLSEIRPPRLHFLGAASTRTLEPRLRIVAEVGLIPEYISADANILRSALYGKIEGNRWAAIRQTLIERSPVLLT